jgi:hypothetical protein
MVQGSGAVWVFLYEGTKSYCGFVMSYWLGFVSSVAMFSFGYSDVLS